MRRSSRRPTTYPWPMIPDHDKTNSDRRREGATYLVALVLLVTLAYWRAVLADFIVFDDDVAIVHNPHVQAGLTLQSIRWAFTTTYYDYWHPLTWISHLVDISLFGMAPWGHHLTNVVLHAVNTLLLYALARQLGFRALSSFVIAGLFGVHPLHVESVAWVVERKDVLSTVCFLTTLLLYLRAERSGRKRWFAASVAVYGLGLMAKPMLVTTPLLLLLIDYHPLRRLRRQDGEIRRAAWRCLRGKLPYMALAGASALSTFTTVAASETTGFSLESLPLLTRVGNAFVSYVTYLGKIFVPHSLAVYYPLRLDLPVWTICGAAMLLGTITIVVFRFRTLLPWALWGWAWYCVSLFPVSGVVQTGSQALADRFVYIPAIGVYVAIIASADWLAARVAVLDRVRLPLTVSVLGLCVVVTTQQVSYWQNSERLFRRTLQVTKDNWFVEHNFGTYLLHAKRYAEAAEHLERSTTINASNPGAWMQLGLALMHLGRLDQATNCFERAARFETAAGEAHHMLGVIAEKTGALTAAVDHYRTALTLSPELWAAHSNLGRVLGDMNSIDEALQHLNTASRLAPDQVVSRFNAGRLMLQAGQPGKAERQFSYVLERTPHNSMARVYRAMALARTARNSEAFTEIDQVLDRRPNHAAAHFVAAVLHASEGACDSAESHVQHSLRPGLGAMERRYLSEHPALLKGIPAGHCDGLAGLREPLD